MQVEMSVFFHFENDKFPYKRLAEVGLQHFGNVLKVPKRLVALTYFFNIQIMSENKL